MNMSIDDMIIVLEAYKLGRPIQKRAPSISEWTNVLENYEEEFDFQYYEYRVKPEPRYEVRTIADKQYVDIQALRDVLPLIAVVGLPSEHVFKHIKEAIDSANSETD